MTWTELRKSLKELPEGKLIDLLKGLYDLSPQNKVWLTAHAMPDEQNTAYLEECQQLENNLAH